MDYIWWFLYTVFFPFLLCVQTNGAAWPHDPTAQAMCSVVIGPPPVAYLVPPDA